MMPDDALSARLWDADNAPPPLAIAASRCTDLLSAFSAERPTANHPLAAKRGKSNRLPTASPLSPYRHHPHGAGSEDFLLPLERRLDSNK
jgi:hypothetical protein